MICAEKVSVGGIRVPAHSGLAKRLALEIRNYLCDGLSKRGRSFCREGKSWMRKGGSREGDGSERCVCGVDITVGVSGDF